MDSDWHSIRPWTRRLALSVREITSVSATFILSSTLNSSNDTEQSLASLGLDLSDDEDGASPQRNRVVAETLAKGLVVKVNNSPWQRVLLRVDDEADEALIILFGLIPGRQYDIELGITPREESLRSQITTDQAPDHPTTATEANGFPITHPDGLQSSLTTDSPTTSPTLTVSTLDASSNSTSPPPTFTVEDRVHQLNHTLSMLQSERESLLGSLKGARKDAQKADASIRGEIDVLKRASDKYAAVEHRARQKVLALQEAVKQTLAAAADTGALVVEVEASLPVLREQRDEAEKEYKLVQEKAEKIREEKILLEKKERKRIESMQTELQALGIKLDKVNGKKDKLETGTIPDLEEELKRIELEIERVERDPLGLSEVSEEGDQLVAGEDRALQSQVDIPNSNVFQPPHHRRKHSSRKSHPPVQRPVQILRPPHAVSNNKPIAPRMSPSTSSTSTLSSLARPFEPSATRQAQLQSTLQSNASSSVKSDLNPTSTVFSPRYATKWSNQSANAGG